MTRFQLHCQTWKDGCGSEFCDGAKKVLWRGDIPCDILFIGEAPGKSENSAGIPFHPGAPAGKLLVHIVKRSVPPTYKVGYTNIVSCIPRDPDSTDKLTEPSIEQISSCKPRLEEIISIANPRLIIAVGQAAKATLERGYTVSVKIPENCTVVHIHHPAFILRQTTAFQGLEVQRCCITIKDAIYLLENPPKPSAPLRKTSPTQRTNSDMITDSNDRPSWDNDNIPF